MPSATVSWHTTRNPMNSPPPPKYFEIYRIQRVSIITGLGRSTIYGLMAEGKFPCQIKLSARAVGWTSTSIFQWLAEREIAG